MTREAIVQREKREKKSHREVLREEKENQRSAQKAGFIFRGCNGIKKKTTEATS